MWSYVVVGMIAAVVALIEILTRYPNAIRQIAKEWAAWTYLGIHVAASLGVPLAVAKLSAHVYSDRGTRQRRKRCQSSRRCVRVVSVDTEHGIPSTGRRSSD